MDKYDAQRIINNAIEGDPNSCLSEHTRGLQAVLDWLHEAPAPQAAPATPTPRLENYHVRITLEDTIPAVSEEEAWELALDALSSRNGMMICGHDIKKVDEVPEDSFRNSKCEANGTG